MNKEEKIKDLVLKIEALVIAIPNEEMAYEHYSELAESYTESSAKEMFRFLAEEELSHKVKLEELKEKLEKELKELQEHDD